MNKKRTALALIFFMAFLPLILYLLWYKIYKAPLNGYNSYYDSVSIDINGKGKMKTISVYTPENHPDEHYVFLPSSAILQESGFYFKGAHVLILSAEGREDAALYSGGNLSNVEKDTVYQASFYSKSGELLEGGRMIFLQSVDTAAVYVETESGGMDNIYEDKDYREFGKIYIEDGDGSIEYMGDLNYIKGHGNTTWLEDKKSFGIMLHLPADLFHMGTSRSWVLMANCLDDTMFANTLVYNMAREAGMPFSPELHYADLYLNGQYNGLYQIAEKNEVGQERIDITDLNTKNKQACNALDPSLYDVYSVNFEDPGERKGFYLPNEPLDITGGYIIEHDYGEKYSDELSRFRTKSGEKYVIRSPVFSSENEVDYIAGLFEELESRAENGEDVWDIADLESFADKYLIEEIVKNDGAGATSSYFYKDSDTVDPKIHAGPVWDYDMSLGNSGRGLTDVADHLDFCTNHIEHTMLFYYLYSGNEEFRKQVAQDYREKFRPLLIELLEGRLDEYRETVDKNCEMNAYRWRRGKNERDEAVETVRSFLEKRIKFLDRVWIDGEKIHIVHLEKDTSGRYPYVGVADGGTMQTLPQPKTKDNEEAHWVINGTGDYFDKNTPVKDDITITSSYYYNREE